MNALSARGVEPASQVSPQALAQKALQANIAHQHALTKYAGQLEAELQELDILIVGFLRAPSFLLTELNQGAVDASDDGNGELEPEFQIPGAKKPTGPCPSAEFLNPVRQLL